MRLVARGLYAAAARLATLAATVVPPSDAKAVIALRARRGIRRRYAAWAAAHRDPARPLLWMHAPSVGEGLMARPVLELIRARRPELQLAYTFFSPSAEPFSRRLDVDFREYLPFDAAGDMTAALDALRPTALVFSKADVWPELVRLAHARGVRVGMISAALAEQSGRRGALVTLLLRDAYARLDAVGAVGDADAARLVQLGVRQEAIEVTGDTRYDQVWQRVAGVKRDAPLLAKFAPRPTLVAGSTWPSDEEPLLEAVARVRREIPTLRLVIAPHEPNAAHIEPIEWWASRRSLTSARVDAPAAGDADVVLVDRVGILADLYAVADVAFVGGGFHGAGLHSVVEPAAFGVPALFGPRHHASRDAALLLEAGGARSVADVAELEATLRTWLGHPEQRRAMGDRARAVVERGRGAAERSRLLVERLLAGAATRS